MAQGYFEKTSTNIRLTDFRLAGFLVARGQKLLSTEINQKREVVFVFELGAFEILAQFPGSPEQTYDTSCKAMHGMVRAALGQKRD